MSISNLSSGPSSVNFRILYALIFVFVVASGLWTIWEPFGRDQGIHATIAFALREGLSTYDDVYNIKPPMTTAAHYLSQVIFGHSTAAIRLFDIVAVVLAMVGVFRLLLMFGYGVVGSLLAPLGFVSLYYTFSFWSRSQTDGWAGFLCVLSLLLLAKGWQNQRVVMFFAAGLALGFGFAFKYTIGALGLVIFAPLLARTDEARFRLADFVAFVAGGFAALGLIALVLLYSGALNDFFAIQTYILSYVSSWGSSTSSMILLAVVTLAANPVFGVLVGIGSVTLLVRLVIGPRSLGAVVIVIWIITSFISLWVQGKGFVYHMLPLFIALSAAVAPAIDMIQRMLVKYLSGRFANLVLTILVVVSVLMPAQMIASAKAVSQLAQGQAPTIPAPDWERLDFSASESQAAGDYLNSVLKPQETIFLWGYDTVIYFLAKRAPQHRYPYTWPFVVKFHDGRYSADLMDRLKAAPPDFFVVQSGDATPWVTGEPRDSSQVLPDFVDLNAFLNDGYEPLKTVGRFAVWKRTAGN